MTIECKRCGGPTMSETVIKLRRSVIGFRETRWQGAYCAACKLSVPMHDPSAIARPRTNLGGLLLTGLRGAPAPRHGWRTARMPS